jgi:hypothetical protein
VGNAILATSPAVAHRHDPADPFDAEDLGVGPIGTG